MRASMALTAAAAPASGLARELRGPLADGGTAVGAGQPRRGGRQLQQPLRLDPDALADEPGFRERCAQRGGAGAVATIDRGERIERRQWLVGGPTCVVQALEVLGFAS